MHQEANQKNILMLNNLLLFRKMEYEPPVHREPAAVGDVAAALRSLQGGLGRPVHGWAHEPGNVLVVVAQLHFA